MSSAPSPSRAERSLARRLGAGWPELVAAGIPMAWLLASRGADLVDPRSLGWLARGDSASHLVGWLFFAREPWHWPPARIESWLVPAGTTLGFADAIPLLAFPLKLLAGALEAPFQFFGLWFAACLILQAVLGSRLLAELGAGERLRAYGGALLALSPVLWDRFERGHFSLAAQWLILAAFLAWARFFRSGGRLRYLAWLAVLPVLAAAIHPYLTLITGALLAAIVPAALRFGARRAAVASGLLALAALVSLAVAHASGFLGAGERLRAGGWGNYSADLAAPLNPGTDSRLLPPLFAASESREGFAYLGLGVLAAGAIGLFLELRARRPAGAPPAAPGERDRHGLRALWIACSLLALVAALPAIRLFGVELASARSLTALLEVPLGAFRANGRLLWPLHALLAVAALRGLRPLAGRPLAGAAVLLLALALQLAERRIPADGPQRDFASGEEVASWRRGAPGVTKVGMLPLYLQDGGDVFCGGIHGDDWSRAAYLAAESGLSFDSGYVARLDAPLARARCAEGEARLVSGRLEPDTIYLVRPRRARIFGKRGIACEPFRGGLWQCRAPAAEVRAPAGGQGAAADQ
jgi:hypothetical protein